MDSLNQKSLTVNDQQIRNARRLIIGRLLAILILVLTSWLWYSGTVDITYDSLPVGPFRVVLVSLGLSALYFFLNVFPEWFSWQVRAQFIFDALLITWLIALTGDMSSPYITLYIVLISVSSLFLRPRATMAMALLSIGLFVLLAAGVETSIIEATGPPQPFGKTIQIVSFHIVAFLVVGMLAARLSERRSSGDELKETAKSLANLRALHERIVESIRSGLITTDLDCTIYNTNAAAAEITGHSAESLRGTSATKIFGDLREPVELSVRADAMGEQLPRFEAELLTPDGFPVRVGYNVCQLFSEEKEATGYVIAFQDLTEIRTMEENVRRKDRLAAVGRVGAGLAHEIRNPLGAMRGAIQVLESTTPPESMQADLMAIILRESDRLNAIITNFLSYARPKVGDFAQTDVCEAIRDTVKLLRHSPDVTEKHKFDVSLPSAPIFISADETQLKQIFWNLARNAIKAMPDGGDLTITLEQVPVDRVRIVFADTGVGMPPGQVEQLFEPFSTSTTGGTGLGLSIVYQIIRDHNGTINVRSAEGEGTKITVEMPIENLRRAESAENGEGATDDSPSKLTEYLNVKSG